MTGFSDYLENKLLNHILGGVAYNPLSTVYVGLSSTDPSEAGGNITEPVGNGYARVAVTNNTTNWPTVSNSTKTNGATITWPQVSGAWGNIAYVVVFDQLVGGNALMGGVLNDPKSPTNGDTVQYGIGAFQLLLN